MWAPDPRQAIVDALQLFGTHTFNLRHRDGFAALCLLDGDDDGRVAGSELVGVALWLDRDVDGISRPQEIESLQRHGIAALRCDDSLVRAEGDHLVIRDGVERAGAPPLELWDLVFERAGAESLTRGGVATCPESLPQSLRSATLGSTRTARRAPGTEARAAVATAPSATEP